MPASVLLAALGSALAQSPPSDEAASFAGLPAPRPEFIRFVKTPRVRIDFELRAGTEPITDIQLWYTTDLSQSWRPARIASGLATPVIWPVPADGLYGMYLIVSNAAGTSSPPPVPGTAPHQWVLVDTTPPSLQARPPALDPKFPLNRQLDIHWTAEDPNLPPRPIDLHYRAASDTLFTAIESALPNTGSFRWTVPSDLAGSITIKVTARDQTGHIAESLAPPIELTAQTSLRQLNNGAPQKPPDTAASTTETQRSQNPAPKPTGAPVANPLPASITGEPPDDPPALADPSSRAHEKYRQATWHRLRAEWAVAEQRFREALEIDPGLVPARNDLAGVLYKQKKYDEAESEYRAILESDPDHASALRGLALVQATRKQYRSAADTLRRLLAVRPDDPEAWLCFGDVTMFMGDRVGARKAWSRAESLAAAAPDLLERARKRLVIYPAEAAP